MPFGVKLFTKVPGSSLPFEITGKELPVKEIVTLVPALSTTNVEDAPVESAKNSLFSLLGSGILKAALACGSFEPSTYVVEAERRSVYVSVEVYINSSIFINL